MQRVIEEQQRELDSYEVRAGHATSVNAFGADHASPVLFDLFDAESVQDAASHASPVLNDATTQTVITVDTLLPDKFFVLDELGQATPVLYDAADMAAGTA
eukprot:5696848-Karenia_brevis.AAC.1